MSFESDIRAAKKASLEASRARKTVNNLKEQTLTEITNNLNIATTEIEELSANTNNLNEMLNSIKSSINTITENLTNLEKRISELESK